MGRYLAILAIIALGVGFFSGLKVTKPGMVETGNKYLREHNFYDFRLLSSIGFDADAVEKCGSRSMCWRQMALTTRI